MFTKFPDYLKFFNQFADLDLERIQDNKRLVRHATKVIDTVTFVVDSIGDPAKSDQLQEALVNLVRSHLKRRIGHKEFYNLGLVLIDFICDLNTRRHKHTKLSSTAAADLSSSADPTARSINNNSRLISNNNNNNINNNAGNSSASSSQDSETMTIALDKIRASSSPSSSSESDENLLARSLAMSTTTTTSDNNDESLLIDTTTTNNTANHRPFDTNNSPIDRHDHHDTNHLANSSPTMALKLDLKLVVGAWKELYGIIMDLVRSEEEGRQEHTHK